MKKAIWKKIISFVLVAALVVGVVYFGRSDAQAESYSKDATYTYFSEDEQEVSNSLFTLAGEVKSKEASAKDVTLNFAVTDKEEYKDHIAAQYDNVTVPIAVSIVIDHSVSMSNSENEAAIKAAKQLIDKIDDIKGAKVQVITYSRNVDAYTEFVDDGKKIKDKTWDKLKRSDNTYGTNTAAALELAHNQLKALNPEPTKKIIVLLSDGCPNVYKDDKGFEIQVGNGTYEPVPAKYTSDIAGKIKEDKSKTAMIITIPFVEKDDNDAKNFLTGIASKKADGSPYSFTATKTGDVNEDGLFKAIATVTTEIAAAYDKTVYATDKILSFELTDNFKFKKSSTSSVGIDDQNHTFTTSYELECTQTADYLVKKYSYDAIKEVVSVPAVKKATVKYSFKNEKDSVSLDTMYVDVAVKNWTVNYHIEKPGDEKAVIIETKKYEFITDPDFVCDVTYAGSVSKHNDVDGDGKAEYDFKDADYKALTKDDIKYNSETRTYDVYYSLRDFTVTINYYEGTEKIEAKRIVFADGTKNPRKETVKYGKDYSYTSPAYTHFTPDKAVVSGENIKADITVDVFYTENAQHTVYFFVDDETESRTSKTVYDGETLNDIPNVNEYKAKDIDNDEKTVTYTIAGWYTNKEDKTTASFKGIKSDMNVYAVNTPDVDWKEYDVIINYFYADGTPAYVVNNGTEASYVRNVTVGQPYDEVIIPAPTAEGYTLDGRFSTNFAGNKVPGCDKMPVPADKKAIVYNVVYTRYYNVEFKVGYDYGKDEAVDYKTVGSIAVASGSAIGEIPTVTVPQDHETEAHDAVLSYSTDGWDKTEAEILATEKDLVVYATIKVTSTPIQHKLTITYSYADKYENAPDLPEKKEKDYNVGSEYNVETPALEGFYATPAQYQTAVKGIMGTGDVEVEIIYRKASHTVTFYVDEKPVYTTSVKDKAALSNEQLTTANEKKAAYLDEMTKEDDYFTYTNTISDWDKGGEVFESITKDIDVYATTETSKKEKVYTVKVVYVTSDGKNVPEPQEKTDVPGTGYKFVSPTINGYNVDKEEVAGTIPVGGAEFKVTYTKKSSGGPSYYWYPSDPDPDPVVTTTPDPDSDPVVTTTPETIVTPTPEKPTPVVEVIEDVIPVETPEGTPEEIVEDIDVIETPEGAPEDDIEDEEIEEVEEEFEVDLPDVPQGLPQTGTLPTVLFFGIGAACIIIGGIVIIKARRREDEM